MKIGVFSDTHGNLARLPAALAAMGPIDAFLHLGDFGTDAELIAKSVNVPFYAVRGNCDFKRTYPAEQIVNLGGAQLLLVHGDRFRDVYHIAERAEATHCAAVLFGHTHVPLLQAQGNILIINPGSMTRPLGGSKPSCALLTIEDGDVNVKMLPLD